MVVKTNEAIFRDLAVDLRRILNLPAKSVSNHFWVKFLGNFLEALKANGGGHLIPEELRVSNYHNALRKLPESDLREISIELLEKVGM